MFFRMKSYISFQIPNIGQVSMLKATKIYVEWKIFGQTDADWYSLSTINK